MIARRDQQSGLGAELPRAEGEGADPALCDRRTPLSCRLRGDEHRVDAAELAIEGDRSRSIGRELCQREATALTAGKGHGIDAVVLDEVDAVLQPVRHHREHTARGARISERLLRDRHDRVAQSRVTRVGLDHDGAARSQCRGSVTSERGEGEGEVGRGEDRDGPERHIQAA